MSNFIESNFDNNFFTRWWFIWALIGTAALFIQIYLMHLPNASNLRDSSQLYFLGKSVRFEASPYQNISSLREMFLGVKDTYQQHPSPYPPLVAVITWPISFLDINTFGILFVLINLLALWGAISELSIIAFGKVLTIKARITLFSLLLVSVPVKLGMYFGQIDPILLFLFSKSVRLLLENSNYFISGGIWCFAVQIKTLGWITAIWISFKNRQFFYGCVVSGIIGLSAVLSLIGLDETIFYLNSVSKNVASFYASNISNQSLISFIFKLLNPVYVKSLNGGFLPVIDKVEINSSMILGIPFLLGALFLFISRKLKIEIGIILSILISLIVSPISWGFYHLNLLLVLALIIRLKLNLPKWIYIGIIFLFVVDIPSVALSSAHYLLSTGTEMIELSKIWVLFGSLPMIFLIFLSLVIFRHQNQKVLE